jgi:short-subunit dehydrogenase
MASLPKRFLLTGVTSGIGSVVLRRCLEDGHEVCAVVRTAAQQQKLQHQFPALELFVADLASRDQVRSILPELQARTFDYVLLNAGCANVSAFHEQSEQEIDDVLEANLLTNMRIVRVLLPGIREHGAKLVLVSSIVARVPGRTFAAYAVSKAGLSHFYACLSLEYPDVPLLCVEIGPVETPFHDKAKLKLEKKTGFKQQDVIGERLYWAILNRTGVTTLAADWACLRKILMLFEDSILAISRWKVRKQGK